MGLTTIYVNPTRSEQGAILPLLCMALAVAQGRHLLTAYNCYAAKAITKYQTDGICNPPTTAPEDGTTYHLYQRSQTRTFTGYHCSVRRSAYPAACGVWGHVKLADVPEILHVQTVSPAWCRDMVTRRKFKLAATSTSFPLSLDRENYISMDEIGSLVRNGNSINCRGQTTHFKKQLLENTVLLTEYVVVVQSTKFMAKEQVVENTDRHIQLPCPLETSSCATGDGTFIWTAPHGKCPLQYVRTIQAVSFQSTFLLDVKNKVLLNTTGRIQPAGCNEVVTRTQYDKLFVSTTTLSHIHQLTPSNLDIELEVRNLAQFLLYLNHLGEERLDEHVQRITCNQRSEQADTPSRLFGNTFILARGSVTYLFQCPEVSLQILTDKRCFTDIPVKSTSEDHAQWVDPTTRVLKHHSTVVPCSPHFPLVIQEGKMWLELPSLRPVAAPQNNTLALRRSEPILSTDFAAGGLYTQDEVNAWESLLSFPSYHQALLRSISLGTCIQANLCQEISGQPHYDLGHMEAFPDWNNPLNWMKKKLEYYGGVCSLVVLFMVAVRLMVDIVLISLIALREGPAAVAVLIVELYCASTMTYKRIKKRNQKMRRRRMCRPAASTDEGLELTSIERMGSHPSNPTHELE